jgi:hypothetical protein
MTRATDISCRTILDRVIYELKISMSGHPSTTLLARKLQTKPDLMRKQLLEFEAAGRIRYNSDKEGWELV